MSARRQERISEENEAYEVVKIPAAALTPSVSVWLYRGSSVCSLQRTKEKKNEVSKRRPGLGVGTFVYREIVGLAGEFGHLLGAGLGLVQDLAQDVPKVAQVDTGAAVVFRRLRVAQHR